MKKVLSLCLAAALALSLAACGKSEPESYPVEVVGPERTSAPMPTADPQAPASPQPGWLVAPRTDIDIQKSLADYDKPQATQLAQQDQLAFFLQNDKIGVIDLDGTVRIPAEKDVHWCSVCGITNSDESEIYEQDGTVVGSGGHGLAGGTIYYDVNSKKVYAEDMGWLYSWEEIKASTNQPFIADAVSITPKEGAGGPDDTYISATDTPVNVSEAQGKIIIMPDGAALDGVVYEDVTSASEGLFAAKMAGLWGFVNATTGQQAVPFVYEAVRPFNEGLAAVKTATGWGYINTSGAEQTGMTFENAQSASGGKAWVKTADGWGVALLSDWKA